MVGVPTLIAAGFVWLPTVFSVVLSGTAWNGIGGLDTIKWIGTLNYTNIFTIYPPFRPAIAHNVVWLLFLALIATPFGVLLAVLLDRNIRGSGVYQSAFFLPVVLSLALVGFIWQLIYSPEQGLLNNLLHTTRPGNLIDWLGNPRINLFAVLVAAGWRHAGYVMVIYLAGLKGVDPGLREAAALDGADEPRTLWYVILPAMRPINIVVLVITMIEGLRAFDIVYIVNKGTNGLELLSVLVTNNIIGEASRIGFGSAIAVILLVISLVPILSYLTQAFRHESRA